VVRYARDAASAIAAADDGQLGDLLVKSKEPVFNVPGAVLGVILVFVSLHLLRLSLSIEDGTAMLLALAFIPARYAGFASEIPGGILASATSFVTHQLVHADWTHLAINSAWLLAFGSVLCRRMGAVRFIAFSICGGIAGACVFLAANIGLAAPVIGASGAVAAMMGGVIRFLFNAIDRNKGYLLRENPAAIPRLSLIQAFTDRRIIMASVVYVAINLFALIGFGTFGGVGTIAWEAHLGGYFFGLLAFAFFDAALQNTSPYSAEIE
jgi:membrane associated rhomboid family serine protease